MSETRLRDSRQARLCLKCKVLDLHIAETPDIEKLDGSRDRDRLDAAPFEAELVNPATLGFVFECQFSDLRHRRLRTQRFRRHSRVRRLLYALPQLLAALDARPLLAQLPVSRKFLPDWLLAREKCAIENLDVLRNADAARGRAAPQSTARKEESARPRAAHGRVFVARFIQRRHVM